MSLTPETNDLLRAAHRGNLRRVKDAVGRGADVNFMPATGLAALHLAVAGSHVAVARFLIEEAGARYVRDGLGRWPTLLAAECQVSGEMCDYIVELEAAILSADPSGSDPDRSRDFA